MGRPQFETIVASAPRERVVYQTFTSSTPVAAGGDSMTSIYAPSGYIGEVLALFTSVQPPIGATTPGHHIQQFGYGPLYAAKGEGNFDQPIEWYYNYWSNAAKRQDPPNNQSQAGALKGSAFDDVTPFVIVYNNRTNAAQTGTREMRILYKLRQVAK